MNEWDLTRLFQLVASGDLSIEEAVLEAKKGPFKLTHLNDATIDHHRSLRHGLCEVIYGESKTTRQILEIARSLEDDGTPVLITRLDPAKQEAIESEYPDGRSNPTAGTFSINPETPKGPESGEPFVAIISAGTSDLPVAEEAAEVCIASSVAYTAINDVGVAGIHRIFGHLDAIHQATALVVVAGMEGALPSVVAGLVGKPLFAVPTSVGYGAHLEGFTPLFAMLNSCSSGVAVVNIDNGFSAAYAACKVVQEVKRAVEQLQATNE
ncbi:MAG TPA: nickel pincer cofactor biosynthesis protein LarB [bacterium]|nr:nickel pincer cofactor biosynthesis protein LarB [bacterium]